VFHKNAGVWSEESRLYPDNLRLFDNGGIAVTIAGADAAINYVGFPKAVHLFRRTNDAWMRTQKIIATNANMEGGFGLSLQMTEGRLAIGSPASTVGGKLGGRVHLFTPNDAVWTHRQTVESAGGFTEQLFGRSIALHSNGLLVGAHGAFAGPNRSGAAFLLEYDLATPVIQSIAATPALLWPPNRKLVPVTLKVAASDDCGPVRCRISGVSSEGALDPRDWLVTGDLSLSLRAVRDPHGKGRNYKVTVACEDNAGHASTADVIIDVPHDRR
jgi:hypothetical protein